MSKEPLHRLATQIRLHRLHGRDGTIFFRLLIVHAAPPYGILQRSPLFTAYSSVYLNFLLYNATLKLEALP